MDSEYWKLAMFINLGQCKLHSKTFQFVTTLLNKLFSIEHIIKQAFSKDKHCETL